MIFKDGVKRAEKNNAIDQYVLGTVGTVSYLPSIACGLLEPYISYLPSIVCGFLELCMSYLSLHYYIFSSPGPKSHVVFCHHLVSHRRPYIFTF